VRYQGELAGTAANRVAVGMEPDLTTLESLGAAIAALRSACASLSATLEHEADSTHAGASHAAAEVLPAMTAVRAAADTLEEMVADDLWPLPTYQEMLFIL
jgi:glutamine synthetase